MVYERLECWLEIYMLTSTRVSKLNETRCNSTVWDLRAGGATSRANRRLPEDLQIRLRPPCEPDGRIANSSVSCERIELERQILVVSADTGVPD